METKRLNLVDTAWLNVETAHAPMQVGGLLTFTLPEGAPADFCARLMAAWRLYKRAFSPWNHRLKGGRLMNVTPEWELLDEIDIDYHFRHSAVPTPGGEIELGALASRLHSHALDLTRPPWECHLIEGLAGNRFAIYIKMHHALIDGVGGMRLLARALASDADDIDRPPFWAIEPRQHAPRPSEQVRPGLYRAVAQIASDARSQVTSLAGFGGVVREMVKSGRSRGEGMGLPFSAPASILNGRINAQRGYATQLYSLSEFKVLARNARVSINDIVLAICGGAVGRYLREIGELPAKPLTAGIPVSIRPADNEDCGNAITFIIATLATNTEDPEERLRKIAASTRYAKRSLMRLSAAAITQYTVALMAPYVLSLVSGMAGRTRPVFNVTVSNVPGPREALYVRGAKMEAFYPTSLVTHGQALNITVHGYADTLGFGFIACRDTVPDIQRLARYAGDALDELRALYGAGGSATVESTAKATAAAQG